MYTHKRTQRAEDGKEFTISKDAAKVSEMLAGEEDDDNDNVVGLERVESEALEKVIEFCNHYATEEMTEIPKPITTSSVSDTVQPWYCKFVQGMDQILLFKVLVAANFMDVKPLLNLCILELTFTIKGKAPEQLETMLTPAIQQGAKDLAARNARKAQAQS